MTTAIDRLGTTFYVAYNIIGTRLPVGEIHGFIRTANPDKGEIGHISSVIIEYIRVHLVDTDNGGLVEVDILELMASLFGGHPMAFGFIIDHIEKEFNK